MSIEKYKTVTITGKFTEFDNFDVDIHIPFIVDEVALKHVSWTDAHFVEYPKPSDPLAVTFPAIKRLYLIKTNMITNNPFYVVGGEYYNSILDIRHKTGGVIIQSNYNFKVCLIDGKDIGIDPTDVDEWNNMNIALTMEFRKYRE